VGANGPRSFDCSGLVQTAYRAAGVGLPRVSRHQYGAGRLVSLRSLRAGDLLFYAKDTSDRRTIYHVGMYLGSGRMVEAPNRRAPVRIASMWRPGLLGKATRPAAGLRGMLAVQQGERSHAVAAVQQRLAANRRCVAVDGEFGPQTRRALVAFQRDHGLTADGVVGASTWGALVTYGRQRSPARC
jgi:NlpC/P60 family/Putative peptidoglycan binding domain